VADREHGTLRGYRQHRYHKDVVCKLCRRAMAADSAPRSAARGRAVARLTREYAARFRELYAEEIAKQN
jgi:hypothetical protein